MVNNMKKSKKVIIWALVLCIFAVIGFGFLYKIINDNTRLTPKENEWLNENLNKVINVTVLNDTNLFGMNGKGLFYDFLNDFSENYGLLIIPMRIHLEFVSVFLMFCQTQKLIFIKIIMFLFLRKMK